MVMVTMFMKRNIPSMAGLREMPSVKSAFDLLLNARTI
jgi:hypothetical protein